MLVPTPRVVLVAIASLAALSLTACGSSGSPSGSNSSPAAAAGAALKVGIDLTYPPYDTREGDTPSGLDPEVVDAIGKKVGMTPTYLDTRFPQLITGLSAGKYDMIASTLYVSPDRAKQVDYVPYFDTGNAILSAPGKTQFTKPSELCGKAVGVLAGTVVYKTLTTTESEKCKTAGQPAISVKDFQTDPEATQALISGQVDAQLTDAAVAAQAAKKSGGKVIVSSTELIYPVSVGFAVKKGNATLKDKIQKAVDDLTSSGELTTVLAKYGVKPVDAAVLKASLEGH